MDECVLGDYNFVDKQVSIEDPVPDDDPEYGTPNKHLYAIFIAAHHDPDYRIRSSPYNIVTDGNQPLKRKLAPGEHTKKRLPGTPRKVIKKTAGVKWQ